MIHSAVTKSSSKSSITGAPRDEKWPGGKCGRTSRCRGLADHLAAVTTDCGCDRAESCSHRRGVELNRIALRYYDSLVRFLKRRSSSTEDAADLAQDTFVRLSAVDLGQVRKPASFLFTTALNLLRDRARSSQARNEAFSMPAEEAQLVCPAPHAERILDGEQRLRVLEEALWELSPKCRAVFRVVPF